MAITKPVIDLARVTKTYGEGETAVHAVAGVDLVVERGEYVAVIHTRLLKRPLVVERERINFP